MTPVVVYITFWICVLITSLVYFNAFFLELLSDVYVIPWTVVRCLRYSLNCCQMSTLFLELLSDVYVIPWTVVRCLSYSLNGCQMSTLFLERLSDVYVIPWTVLTKCTSLDQQHNVDIKLLLETHTLSLIYVWSDGERHFTILVININAGYHPQLIILQFISETKHNITCISLSRLLGAHSLFVHRKLLSVRQSSGI